MIPIKDHNPSGKIPVVTYLLIVANSLVFIVMFTLSEPALEAFIQNYALIPSLVTSGQKLYAFITSMFLHGGIAHIIGNMLFLHIFGDNLEEYFGHVKFLLFYLLGGIFASALHVLVSSGSTVPVLGASGAIAAVMGGYLVLFPRHRIDVLFGFGYLVRRATLPAFTMLFYWFIFQFFVGVGSLAAADQNMGGVAYFSHVGGFVYGWLGTKIFKKRN